MEGARLKISVRKAARGDEEAAGELFDHYYPRVYRYALARMGAAHDAEDVAAETFARVLRDLDRFRWKGAGFEAWLFRIASNLVVDRFRRGGRELVDYDVAARADTVELRTPETIFAENEVGERLLAFVDELSDDQREVVLLRFAAGLDTSEVGRVMGKNPNAVRQLQFRALEGLRKKMSDVERA